MRTLAVHGETPVDQAAVAVLGKHCIECHGAGGMGGLDLRQRATIFKGGKRGPAIMPGKAEESPLYLSASHRGDLKMPFGRAPIPAEDLEILKRWIDQGALWPGVPQFEQDVVPILKAHCWKCHGMEDRKASLDLRTPPLMLKGNDRGPVLVQKAADRSPLFQKVANGSMPPGDEKKLNKEQVETLRRWIEGGAPASRYYGPLTAAEAPPVTAEDRRFWAFRKLVEPKIPRVGRTVRVRTPVDAFVLAKLEAAKLAFSPDADRLTLIRRASLDLVGLPPSSEEVDAFLRDRSPNAYEQLIDRLLGSPHFGERWARHWLDLAGYSDILGADNDAALPPAKIGENKWRYRDYVVRSFNEDKPYDRFLVEQIAGDELYDWRSAERFTPEMQEALVATGFLRCAPDDTDQYELNTADLRYAALHHTVQTVLSNVLGLTVGCAQCHSHRYDPVPQRDYYRLTAIFAPAFNPQSWLQPKDRLVPEVSAVEKAEIDRHNAEINRRLEPFKKRLARIRQPHEDSLLDEKLKILPKSLRQDTKAALRTSVDQLTPVQKYLEQKLGNLVKISTEELEARLSAEEKTKVAELKAEMAPLESQLRSYAFLNSVIDTSPSTPVYLLRRGNPETPGPEVEPGFLTALTEPDKAATIPEPISGMKTSGRRLALARWLTARASPSGALVARVMTNRIWQHLFGEGIVSTPENFGRSGMAPSHPELLEWLAVEFGRRDWRIKPMVKLLVMSTAYRQSSHQRPSPSSARAMVRQPENTGADPFVVDPGNGLLWRMRLRRLESEIVRDSILTVSGRLERTIGGPSVPVEAQPNGMVVIAKKDAPQSANPDRRSLYLMARRNYNLSLLSVFDQPPMNTNCPKRTASAVVLQSLFMLNDSFVLEQSRHFAQRISKMAHHDPETKIALAFQLALGRKPSAKETAWGRDLLISQTSRVAGSSAPDEQQALVSLCHVLLNTNEFLYIP